jgi:hypothetical protein
MKSMFGLAFGIAAALTATGALADEETKTKTTTATTSSDSYAQPPATTGTTTTTANPDGSTTVQTAPTYEAQPMTQQASSSSMTTTSTTSTHDDTYVEGRRDGDDRPRVKGGIGINAFGTAGTKETARLGVGGRIEFVLPFGLALGGSYTQHFVSEGDRSAVRPLLGEIGWAIPAARRLEVRPMVGLGYAFASSSGNTNATEAGSNQAQTSSASVSTSGFDVAPGAKVSYLAGNIFEIYTLPKYHFISGNNFLGVELGAGARF